MLDTLTPYINPSPIILGRQIIILGTGASPETNHRAPLIGVALGINTTYYFVLPVFGASAVDVLLRFSVVGGVAPVCSIYKALNDGTAGARTEKMGPAGTSAAVAFPAFTQGVQQTASISTLRGEKNIVLQVIVGANSCTLDQAEYSAL